MPRFARTVLVTLVVLGLGFTANAFAGTQDFTLINQTGVEVWRLFVSETSNDDWEEDVLGDDTLPDGSRIDMSFAGRSACLWDILVTDSDENELVFQGINLCEVSVVVMHCRDGECWADYE